MCVSSRSNLAKTDVFFFSLVAGVGAAGVLVGMVFAVDLCVVGRSLKGPLRCGGGGVVVGLACGRGTGVFGSLMFFSDASGVVDGSCVDGSSSGGLRHCRGCGGFANARGMLRCMAGLFRAVLQVDRIEINVEVHGSLAATSLGVWGLYVRGDSGYRRVLH